MMLRHFAISQRGESHIARGTNCQDFSGSTEVENVNIHQKIAIAAIADGVGSCDYSEEGSKIAVTTALENLSENLAKLENIRDAEIAALLKQTFNLANQNIQEEADASQRPFLLFDTTLTVALVFEDGRSYFGHIGDDGIVALFTDGTYQMITPRIKGEEANSVVPLSQKKYWTFGKSPKNVAALMLMTDGILDSVVRPDNFPGWYETRVFYPFFAPAFENPMDTEESMEGMRESWDEYLKSEDNRKRVTDDITVALIQRVEQIGTVKPVFDEVKWNWETKDNRRREEWKLKQPDAGGWDEEEEHRRWEDWKRTHTKPKPKPNPKSGPDAEAKDPNKSNSKLPPTDAAQATQPGAQTDTDVPRTDAPNQQPPMPKPTKSADAPVNSNVSQNIVSPKPRQGTKSDAGRPSDEAPQKRGAAQKGKRRGCIKKKSPSINYRLKTIIAILSCVCIVVCGCAVFRSIGHNDDQSSGHSDGHEEDYSRGYENGKQEGQTEANTGIEEKLAAEYDRGYAAGQSEAVSVNEDPENFERKLGDRGPIVSKIQRKLMAKGWEVSTDGDGIYGEATEQAVRQFQQINQLEVTGKVDILTYMALLNETSLGCLQDDTAAASQSTEQSEVIPTAAPKAPEETINPQKSVEFSAASE